MQTQTEQTRRIIASWRDADFSLLADLAFPTNPAGELSQLSYSMTKKHNTSISSGGTCDTSISSHGCCDNTSISSGGTCDTSISSHGCCDNTNISQGGTCDTSISSTGCC